jgi:hypothetical protein
MSTQPQSCGASGRGRGAGTATRRFAPAAADIRFAPDSGRSERFGLKRSRPRGLCNALSHASKRSVCALPAAQVAALPYVAGQRLTRGRGWRRPRRIGSRRRLKPQLLLTAAPTRGLGPRRLPDRGTARTNSRGPSLHLRRIARSPSSRASGILHATRSAKSQRCRAPPQPPSYYKNPHRPRRRHAK